MILFNVKEPEQQEEKPETTQAEVIQNPETMTQTAESIEDKYKVFDTMSEDWGSDDLEGFVFYDLPEKYADKGYFPEKMQIYTRCLCKQNDVPYALVLAIIEYESGYEFDKNGGAGQMKTYRQKHPYIAQIGYILRYKLQRFTWMFKVKDCRHICLFCEYYDTCRQEGKGK